MDGTLGEAGGGCAEGVPLTQVVAERHLDSLDSVFEEKDGKWEEAGAVGGEVGAAFPVMEVDPLARILEFDGPRSEGARADGDAIKIVTDGERADRDKAEIDILLQVDGKRVIGATVGVVGDRMRNAGGVKRKVVGIEERRFERKRARAIGERGGGEIFGGGVFGFVRVVLTPTAAHPRGEGGRLGCGEDILVGTPFDEGAGKFGAVAEVVGETDEFIFDGDDAVVFGERHWGKPCRVVHCHILI